MVGGDHGQECIFLTSSTKDNSVPGDKQTATFLSSGAAKPRVLQPNIRIVSLSSTLAGRVLHGMEAVVAHLLLLHALTQTPAYAFSSLGASGSVRNQKSGETLSADPAHKNGDLCPC